MNDIERTVGDINKVWLAGFRAGVEAAKKKCEDVYGGHAHTYASENATTYRIQDQTIASCVKAIRSLLNESGAAEKDEA